MKKDQAVAWLKLLGAKVPGLQPRSKWAISDCPLGSWRHDEGKSSPVVFGVRSEPGDSLCTCFSCGWHGLQSDLVVEMSRLNKASPQGTFPLGEALQLIAKAEEEALVEGLDSPGIEEVLFGEKQGMHLFPDWWLETFLPVQGHPWATHYVRHGREGCDPVPDAVLADLDVRVDTEQKRVCFPVRDFQGRLVGLHGRAVQDGVSPRYRMYSQAGRNNPVVWLGESWVDLERPVVVVEGPFDLASVRRVYGNVVTPLFSNPSLDKLMRMAGAMEVVTFLDRGTGGDVGRAKFTKGLKDSVVRHVVPPKGKKDPGACTVPELQEVLGPLVGLHDPVA